MKKLLSAAGFFAVIAVSAQAGVIETFMGTCVSDLGNPSAIAARGESMGFDMMNIASNQWLGMHGGIDQSLQVNVSTRHAFECAVTTSDAANPAALRAAFFAKLGLAPQGDVAAGVINGNTYHFAFDTDGGEALVVYAD